MKNIFYVLCSSPTILMILILLNSGGAMSGPSFSYFISLVLALAIFSPMLFILAVFSALVSKPGNRQGFWIAAVAVAAPGLIVFLLVQHSK